MNPVASALLEELNAAFAAKRDRWIGPLINSYLGDEPADIAKAFADKEDWTQLEAEWLDKVPDGLVSAMSFLSDEAICFYLPAFVAADIRRRLERVNPSFYLFHGFDEGSRHKLIGGLSIGTWTERATERWRRLTAEQVSAVVHYLEWKVASEGPGFAQEETEALAYYWYPRLAAEAPKPAKRSKPRKR